MSTGYAFTRVKSHPRSKDGKIAIHILVVEKALGHYLMLPACVHHINEIKTDNANTNLVVLQNNAEHRTLHRRLRVLRAGGNPWTQLMCVYCKTPKDLLEFYKLSLSSLNKIGYSTV